MTARHISGTAPRDDTPAGHGRPKQGKGEERFAKARQRSQSGPGATAFLRARRVDSSRVIPASECVSAGRRFLGMEEFLATRRPCCGATDADTRHARLCHQSGAHANQHQPLIHALSRTFKRMSIRQKVESGAPLNADRDLRMDMVVEREPWKLPWKYMKGFTVVEVEASITSTKCSFHENVPWNLP